MVSRAAPCLFIRKNNNYIVRQKVEAYIALKPTDKELAFMHTWENQRSFPKWKFILFHGIFKEGLLLFIFIKLLQYFFERDAFSVFYSSLHGVIFLFFEILFWFFGGFVIGWFKYNTREIEYELLKGLSE
jgi:hypothetical protein